MKTNALEKSNFDSSKVIIDGGMLYVGRPRYFANI